jgi:hypothetical protein
MSQTLITPNTPFVVTNLINQANPFNYTNYGMAMLDYGICQIVQTNAVGMMTYGFVWQGGEIWFDTQSVANLTTGWTAAAGYSGSATLITTIWSPSPTGGLEYLV